MENWKTPDGAPNELLSKIASEYNTLIAGSLGSGKSDTDAEKMQRLQKSRAELARLRNNKPARAAINLNNNNNNYYNYITPIAERKPGFMECALKFIFAITGGACVICTTIIFAVLIF